MLISAAPAVADTHANRKVPANSSRISEALRLTRARFLALSAQRCRGRGAINSASSAIHRRPNKRPDRFDLLRIEHALPWRHLRLAVEHRIDETITVGRTQTPEIERGAAAGVA